VINIIKFYEVYCDVEPKRKALAQANAELAFAQDKLGVIKRKVVVCKLTKFRLFLDVTNNWV
jgi:Microtubule-binding stalk of dynein motor